MALRILSGIVFIRGGLGVGRVEIRFNPFRLADGSDPRFELRKPRAIGPAERFVTEPASIVAARQFALATSLSPVAVVEINDTVTRDSITISWDAPRAPVFEEEIPFMIVGVVPDSLTDPVRGPIGPAVPRVSPRRRAPARRAGKKKRAT